MRFNRKLVMRGTIAAAAAAVSLRCSNLRADTYNWTGTGVDGDWSTASNWNFAFTTPGSGDLAHFASDEGAVRATSVVDGNRSVGTLQVNGASDVGNYVFTGSNTTLTVNDLFEAGGGTVCFPTISSGLTINTPVLQLSTACGLTISGGGSVSTPKFEAINSGTTSGLTIGNQGALTLTGTGTLSNATLELDSGGQLLMNSGASLTATSSTGQLYFTTNWAVPAGATVKALSGADIYSTSYLDVGSGGTGTLLVDGSGSSATIGTGTTVYSDWGIPNGSATVTFSTSATGNYKSGLHIANAGGTAHVNINTDAQLTVSNGLLVGGGATSAATLTLNTATLAIGSGGSANFGSGSTFNFQSGTLALAGNATFSTGSTFNWSGGTLTGTGQTLGISGGVASVTLGGIGINGNTLSITNGGHFDSSSWIDVGTIASSSGTLLVSGANSRITTSATSFSDWSLVSGSAATITFSNSGVGTYSSGVHMSNQGGASTLNINTGGVLNIAQAFLVSGPTAGTANITLATGTLNSTGTTQFNKGTTLTADAFSELNFSDNATFSTGSSVNLSSTVLSLPSGKTLTVDGGVVTDTRNALLGSGETYIIQNGGHWDAVTENLNGGTLTVTGSGSRFTGSGTESSEWDGPGLNANFTNGGIGTFAGGVFFGGNADIDQLNVATLSTLQFGSLTTFENDTENGVTGATTISIDRTSTLTVTGNATFSNGAVVNENGGLTFDGNATFTTGSTLHASGLYSLNTGSQTTLAFAGGVGTFTNAFSVPNGNTLRVTNGGKFTDNVELDVANGQSTGTLLVDGSTSTLNANNILFRSNWGTNTGNVATVTFSTSAVGSITPGVLMSTNGGTTNFNIFTSAKVTMGDLTVGSATTSSRGFITITNGTLNVTSGATLNHGTDLEFNSGSLNIGGTLTMEDDAFAESAAPLIQLGGLSMTGSAKLNLEGGKMIVSNTPLATIQGYITTGYHSAAWTGNGIYSTTAHSSGGFGAIGYASAGSIGLTSFAGQHVNPADTLIRYTYYGDTNLDGTVNALDFNALATSFSKSGKFWSNGDFNFDGSVNSQDFALLAANYGKVIPGSADVPDDAAPAAAIPLGAVVPEPQMIAALAAMGALQRRRRPV